MITLDHCSVSARILAQWRSRLPMDPVTGKIFAAPEDLRALIGELLVVIDGLHTKPQRRGLLGVRRIFHA